MTGKDALFFSELNPTWWYEKSTADIKSHSWPTLFTPWLSCRRRRIPNPHTEVGPTCSQSNAFRKVMGGGGGKRLFFFLLGLLPYSLRYIYLAFICRFHRNMGDNLQALSAEKLNLAVSKAVNAAFSHLSSKQKPGFPGMRQLAAANFPHWEFSTKNFCLVTPIWTDKKRIGVLAIQAARLKVERPLEVFVLPLSWSFLQTISSPPPTGLAAGIGV